MSSFTNFFRYFQKFTNKLHASECMDLLLSVWKVTFLEVLVYIKNSKVFSTKILPEIIQKNLRKLIPKFLTIFRPMFPFYTPWKQRPSDVSWGILTYPRGDRKRKLTWNGLNHIFDWILVWNAAWSVCIQSFSGPYFPAHGLNTVEVNLCI